MVDEIEDEESRIEALLAGAGAFLRRRILESVQQITDRYTLEELIDLLIARRYDEALVSAEIAANNIATAVSSSFLRSGEDTMAFISNSINVLVTFDLSNAAAVDAMRRNQLRLVSEFVREQQLATRLAIIDGIARGLSPTQQAILFRQSIGLTRQQVQAVLNYRRLLEAGDADALQRALRDRRFDPSVRSAVDGTRPLTPSQIEMMVSRYRDRYLAHRVRTIAETEALGAVYEGAHHAYRQAIAAGHLSADQLIREWITAADERVRHSHSRMEGQERSILEPFLSGSGNLLMYPGDSNAPASDRIGCRCALRTRFRIDAVPRDVA